MQALSLFVFVGREFPSRLCGNAARKSSPYKIKIFGTFSEIIKIFVFNSLKINIVQIWFYFVSIFDIIYFLY